MEALPVMASKPHRTRQSCFVPIRCSDKLRRLDGIPEPLKHYLSNLRNASTPCNLFVPQLVGQTDRALALCQPEGE